MDMPTKGYIINVFFHILIYNIDFMSSVNVDISIWE